MANRTIFQDPEIIYPNQDLNLPFADYIQQCRTLIEAYRLDLSTANDPLTIIEANCPYELLPKPNAQTETTRKRGALLIHGLLDSPLILKDIALDLQSQGLVVRSLLLPGHGTVPGALLKVTYEEWMQALEYGIHSMESEVDELFLVGFSTGASLSLLHVLRHQPKNIAGLILLAPALKIKSPWAFTQSWFMKLGCIWKRAQWLYIDKEYDYAKYQSTAFNAGYQVYRLANAILKLSKTQKLTYPLLTILAEDDETVSSKATLKYLKQYALGKHSTILYTNHPEHYQADPVITRPASYPEWRIINMSHVAIPNSADNPHYGKTGDYPYASHIADTRYCYGTRNNVKNKFAQSFLGVAAQLRLSFNPDYAYMKTAIYDFIAKD